MLVLDLASGARLSDFWAWPGWTVVGSALTLLAVLVAVVTVKYARESAQAAQAAVKPLSEMAANLTTAATTLKDMAADLASTATTMKANLELAERGRREDRLVHRLEQYEQVMLAVQKMAEGRRRQGSGRTVEYFEEARAELQAALSVIPVPMLSACRTLAAGTFVQANLDAARAEIKNALSRVVGSNPPPNQTPPTKTAPFQAPFV